MAPPVRLTAQTTASETPWLDALGRLGSLDLKVVAVIALVICSPLFAYTVGPVKVPQFIALAGLGGLLAGLFRVGRVPPLYLWYAGACLGVFVVAGVVAVFRATELVPTFFPLQMSFVHQPGMIQIARAVEILAGLSTGLLVASLDQQLLERAMRAFIYAAIGSAIYGLASFPIAPTLHLGMGIEMKYLGAFVSPAGIRLTGTFHEGGPFGFFAVGAIVFLWVHWYTVRAWRLSRYLFFTGVLGLAWYLSMSKTSLAVGSFVALAIGASMLPAVVRRPLVVFGFLVVMVGFLALHQYPNISFVILAGAHFVAYGTVEVGEGLAARSAAPFIVPRLIEYFPNSGVGWGHYGLIRNNPEFQIIPLQELSYYASGVGYDLFTHLVELGVPLTAVLAAVQSIPVLVGVWTGRLYLAALGAFCLPFAWAVLPITAIFGWVLIGFWFALHWREHNRSPPASA